MPSQGSESDRARQEEFCRGMAQGLTQTGAARKAGYSNPKTAGNRLAKRAYIIAAIAILKAERAAATPINTDMPEEGDTQDQRSEDVDTVNHRHPVPAYPVDRDGGEEPRRDPRFSRTHQQRGLALALGMALGEIEQPRPVKVMPPSTEAEPAPKPVVHTVLVKEADPRAAAYIASLMGQELTRVEKLNPEPRGGGDDGRTIDGQVRELSPAEMAMAAFEAKHGLIPAPAGWDPNKEG